MLYEPGFQNWSLPGSDGIMTLQEEFIYIAALRYALYKESCAVEVISDEIKRHIDEFSMDFLKTAISDIRDRPFIRFTDSKWKDFYQYLLNYFKTKYN